MHSVGRIKREMFREIAPDITTDKVIITDERIEHCNRHNHAYDRYADFIPALLADPDVILEDFLPYTAILMKKIPDNFGLSTYLVLRLHAPQDNPAYRNSVISFWDIGEKRRKNYESSRKVIYKKDEINYNENVPESGL